MIHHLILGSRSARRKEILSFFSIPFVQISSDFDENTIHFAGDPQQYALSLARKKAETLSQRFPDHCILTADTVVYFKDKVYNKPINEEHAHAMLKELSGHWHSVITAIAIRYHNTITSNWEETRVLLHPLSEEQITLYHRNCHFLDIAGSYTVQKAGNIIISRIEGCYYNVMGLPLKTLRTLLLHAGIDIWNYLHPF